MNFFELLNRFFLEATIRKSPSNARLTYLAILYKWNAFRREPTVRISDKELIDLTNLTQREVTSAKRYLKNVGLLDFTTTSRGTLYKLKWCANCRESVEQNVSEPSITITQNVVIKKKVERGRTRGGDEEIAFELY